MTVLDNIAHAQFSLMRMQAKEHSCSGRTQHWKITALRGGVILWIGNICDEIDAWKFWHKLQNNALGYQDYTIPQPAYCPSIKEIEGVMYEFATVVAFTTIGSTAWTNSANAPTVDYLVVAGGGGGGRLGGGGGAGAVLTGSFSASNGDTFSVSVGAGGAGSTIRTNKGTNGSDSSVGVITATGGGGGGSFNNIAGANGGSGGGGSSNGGGNGGLGTTGGNNGGKGSVLNNNGGGGGGAGAIGQAAAANSGNGGDGVSSSISGTLVFYGGGGGGTKDAGTGGDGGAGGGGAGTSGNANGIDGTNNTGGGGGASRDAGATGGNGGSGGSGIVIISFTPRLFTGFVMPMMGM